MGWHRVAVLLLAVGLVSALCGGCEGGTESTRETGDAPGSGARSSPQLEAAPQERLRAALRVGDPVERSALLSATLAELGPESVGIVRENFLPPNRSDPSALDAALIIQWWAQHEPKAAVEWAAKQLLMPEAPMYGRLALGIWATDDFDAAAEFLEARASTVLSDELVRRRLSLVRSGYAAGRSEVMLYLLSIPAGFERQQLIRQLVRRVLFLEGPEALVAWADSLPGAEDPKFKLQVNRRVGLELVTADRELAQRWASNVYDGDYGAAVLTFVARAMAAHGHGLGAMQWLSQLPPGVEAGAAVREAYGRWHGQDPETALAWIAETPLEPWMHPALAPHAVIRAKIDGPEVGLAWAQKIQDAELRQATRVRIGRGWFLSDPEAARAWADAQDFSDHEMGLIVAPREGASGGAGAAVRP